MCTLTWKTWPQGYELHFNRDESRARPKAKLPSIQSDSTPQVITPQDSEGGTWISVNQSGLSLCLLNNYLAANHYQGTTSRGLLVQALSSAESLGQAQAVIAELNLSDYSPFDLVIFAPDQTPTRINWDGKTASETIQTMPFVSSSGYKTLAVINGRQEQFLQESAASLEAFHESHLPERSGYSVCMHREDARTQSYSKIQVTQNTCELWYTDGPPCQSALQGPWSLQRPQ